MWRGEDGPASTSQCRLLRADAPGVKRAMKFVASWD